MENRENPNGRSKGNNVYKSPNKTPRKAGRPNEMTSAPTIERSLICPSWEPKSDQHACDWITEHFELPPDSELTRMDFEVFPLARFVIDQLAHNELLRRFTEMVSTQSGKTSNVLAYLCWKIKNKPSGAAWYTDTNINAIGDAKTKLLDTFESCRVIKDLLPSDRHKKGLKLIQFQTMNLRIMGADSKGNREGKTISEVLCDEVRNYKPGAMEQIDGRFKTITNWRRIIFSAAGETTNEPWLSFTKGTRHMGFWKCPHCDHKQTFRFGKKKSALYPDSRTCGGFVWDDNATTHPSDLVYNIPELLKTVRYECENEKCKKHLEEHEKLNLIRTTVFEQTNPMADPRSDVSVHCWEAYMPFPGCSLASIVTRYLKALVAMKQGNISPMKIFVTETLGEPWEIRGEKPEVGEIMKRCGEYSMGEEQPAEIKCAKVLTFDNQLGFIVFVYRLWCYGKSWLVDCGRLADLDELRTYQRAKGIQDAGVGGDVSYRPRDVYAHCLAHGGWQKIAETEKQTGGIPSGTLQQSVRLRGALYIWNGWLPMMGDEAKEFTMSIGGVATKTTTKPVVLNAMEGQPGAPREIQRLSWSKPHYQEWLHMTALTGQCEWFIPKNVPQEYAKQMSEVERLTVTDFEGRITGYKYPDKERHDYPDCERMNAALADYRVVTKR